jgi:glycosyltransferase involved in cell wall biosynthesis
MKGNKSKIIFFIRKKRKIGNNSIENYFNTVVSNVNSEFDSKLIAMPFFSNGLINMVLNSIFCYFNQGDVNHVTGDIHYVTIFLKKSKTILTIHDCGRILDLSGIKLSIYKLLWFDLPINKSRFITTVSEYSKEEILKYTNCKIDKIKVIHVCNDEDFKKRPEKRISEIPIILQIGTTKNKNLENLITALKNLKIKLIIIGPVSHKINKLLKNCVFAYEVFDYNLSKIELIDQYYKSDILTFVSTLEGFGMPIIESNSIGIPVLTSNITSMPEIAGEAALIVNPYDINEIKSGILKLISDSVYRNDLIIKGFQNTTRFNSTIITNEFIKLYKKILN